MFFAVGRIKTENSYVFELSFFAISTTRLNLIKCASKSSDILTFPIGEPIDENAYAVRVHCIFKLSISLSVSFEMFFPFTPRTSKIFYAKLV
ncbi:MAG: hypothetical protein L6V93_14470 [Clostridiales bacterium]|nr:MAG: hypothetical protein L6V93_14470 [Clostridiales bacterium]